MTTHQSSNPFLWWAVSGGSSDVPKRNFGADLRVTVVIKGILKTCQHCPTSWVWLLDCLQSPRWEAVCLMVLTQVFAYVAFLPSANPSCWHCPTQHTKWQPPFGSSLVGPPARDQACQALSPTPVVPPRGRPPLPVHHSPQKARAALLSGAICSGSISLVSPRQRGPQGSRRVAAATRCSRLQPRHHWGRIWVCWKHRVLPGLKSQGGRRIATWADTNVCLHLPP